MVEIKSEGDEVGLQFSCKLKLTSKFCRSFGLGRVPHLHYADLTSSSLMRGPTHPPPDEKYATLKVSKYNVLKVVNIESSRSQYDFL